MTFGRRRGLALALTPAGSGERSRFSGGRGELVAGGVLPGLFASVGSRATQRESPSPVAASVGFLWPVCWSSRGSGVGTPSNDPARILESRNPSSGASRQTSRSRPVGPALPSIDGGACWGLPPSVRDARPGPSRATWPLRHTLSSSGPAHGPTRVSEQALQCRPVCHALRVPRASPPVPGCDAMET